jgi:EAL domain-containing protein (putative c-di-GMP-specific phosphodiesterase class I)/DNA-binding response OmpR family regulator
MDPVDDAVAELLLYQPLVDLRNGAVASLEAVVRQPHGAAGEQLLRRTCLDRRLWDGGVLAGAEVQVAINVGAQQLHDPAFGPAVAALLAQHGLDPRALTLELTEATLLKDAAASDAALDFFKRIGTCLVLDQFGTGPASLANLRRFPFDFIKIDARFVREAVVNHSAGALTKAIIAMAHNMGIRVVAEGVDTEAQCAFLREHLCDLIQGDFYAPPLPPAEVGELLRADRRLAPHLLRTQTRHRSLLLVDDEANILSALKRLLRPDGYEIRTAASGEEGLELLAQHSFDVIVSDQRMPGMDGADFLRQARNLRPDTIRIMLSGYTELQSVTDAVNEGAIFKFLTKPWNDEQLRHHLAEAFRLKEIADDNERLNMEVRTANHELASANRRMEQLLHHMQRQIHRDEISLNIAREILQHLPLPVIGMDEDGMIAFINAAAGRVLRRSGALLGNDAGSALPELFPAAGITLPPLGHQASIDGLRYAVTVYPMGERSAARGSLITLSRCEEDA